MDETQLFCTVTAWTVSGRPALRAATRAMLGGGEGLAHPADEDAVDLVLGELGAGEGGGDGVDHEVLGLDAGQGPGDVPDRGAGSAGDDDGLGFRVHGVGLSQQ